jgi:CRISPR-associated protein Csm1
MLIPVDPHIIYGALLHDIGKLFYKAGRENNHVQAGLKEAKKLFNENIPPIVNDAIACHHAKDLYKTGNTVSAETWLIYEADNIAAGLDRREEKELREETQEQPDKGGRLFDKEMPLKSTFSLLKEQRESEKSDCSSQNNTWGYRLTFLGEETPDNSTPFIVYPQELKPDSEVKASRDKYEAIAKKWDTEVGSSRDILCKKPNALLLLMESLLSYAPSDTSTERIPDISLYEHLRLTAAIASCMYVHAKATNAEFKDRGDSSKSSEHRTLNQFLLVGGDVSGIQQFIYNITGKGALKSLRARSFYLEVLIEHVMDDILQECGGFSRANIIYSGGGHFYLLLPNTTHVQKVLKKAQTNLNQFLWEQFRGGLSVAIASVPCSSQELMDPQDPEGKRQGLLIQKWKDLSTLLSVYKARKFSDFSEETFKTLFEPAGNPLSSAECAITHSDHDLIQDEQDVFCNRLAAGLHTLGKELPKADYVYIQRQAKKITNTEEHWVVLPDVFNPGQYCTLKVMESVHSKKGDLLPEDEQTVKTSTGRLYSLNRWVLSEYLHANLLIGQYYGPEDKGAMPDFNDLAKKSVGAQKIGVLRADVDNLGSLFKSKLPKEVNTFSRVAMLSKQLTLFFKLYINGICSGDLRLPDSSSDLSKGDPFYVLSDSEQRKQECENSKKRNVVIVYSGGDDLFIVGAWNEVLELAVDLRRAFHQYTCGKLTFSAGVQVFDPHTPISLMAEMTGEAEKKAKKYTLPNTDEAEKNALCLFPNPKSLVDQHEKDKKRSYQHRDVYSWSDLLKQSNSETKSQEQHLLQMIQQFAKAAGVKAKQDNENKDNFNRETGWLNPSLLYQLYHLAEVWSLKGYVALPKLAYLFARLEEDEKKGTDENYKALKAFLYQSNWLDEDKNKLQQVGLQDYKTLCTWISYLQREEQPK